MGYVAAGYIAVFGTIGIYAGWTIVRARRAASDVLRSRRRGTGDTDNGGPSPTEER